MTRRVIIRPAAEAELREAFQWYEQQQSGLGLGFLRCVDACIAKAGRNPRTHAKVHGNIRRALVRRFPYGVFYVEKEDTLVVIAVFHGSRDPKQWRDLPQE